MNEFDQRWETANFLFNVISRSCRNVLRSSSHDKVASVASSYTENILVTSLEHDIIPHTRRIWEKVKLNAYFILSRQLSCFRVVLQQIQPQYGYVVSISVMKDTEGWGKEQPVWAVLAALVILSPACSQTDYLRSIPHPPTPSPPTRVTWFTSTSLHYLWTLCLCDLVHIL